MIISSLLLGANAYGFEETAEAVMRLMNCLLVEKAVLVGYSLGARLALHLAAKHGQRLQTVVSISGSTGLSGETVLSLCNYTAGILRLGTLQPTCRSYISHAILMCQDMLCC